MTKDYRCFFCLLDDPGEDRCKLRLDLPPRLHGHASATNLTVGTIRAALKQELGWRSSEIGLYVLSPAHKDKRFDAVHLEHCQKLIDDEANVAADLFFVKHLLRRSSNFHQSSAMVQCDESPASPGVSQSLANTQSTSPSSPIYESQQGDNLVVYGKRSRSLEESTDSQSPANDSGKLKSRRMESCYESTPPNSSFGDSYRRERQYQSSGGADSCSVSPHQSRSMARYSDHSYHHHHHHHNRPPSPPESNRPVYNSYMPAAPPLPPPPPPPGSGRSQQNSSSSSRQVAGARSETRRPNPAPPSNNNTAWNRNSSGSRKAVVEGGNSPGVVPCRSKMQKSKQVGDAPRQAARPRAPVVHNLISKQQFLEEMQSVVARIFRERGEVVLPYRIDSLGDICITHDVKVPATYSWRRIEQAPEYQSLLPQHRLLLESGGGAQIGEEGGAATVDGELPPHDDDDHHRHRREGKDDDSSFSAVKEFETTICFVEIAQERLLVFDWYVYAMEAIAEYRDNLTDGDVGEIFYIYGHPRIGKSICVLFLAIAAAFVGETIYYFCDSKIWEVGPTRVSRWTIQELLRTPPPLPPAKGHKVQPSRRFLFTELRIREQEDVLADLRRLGKHLNLAIVASGVPDAQLIEKRSRVRAAGDGQASAALPQNSDSGPKALPYLFVPPPAWHELYALKILVYPSISRSEFEFRYYLFGPVPRNIISETGPFNYVIETWKQQQKLVSPAVIDLLHGEPPRLATLLLPVDSDGNPTAGATTQVMLSYVSAAAEAVLSSTCL